MGNGNIDHIIQLTSDSLGGSSDVGLFHVLFAGKTASERFPYIVFNEKVAGEIGRVLGLNCPEVLVEQFSKRTYFFSHWQETSELGTALPPGATVDIAKYFETNSDIIHGMLVFDMFVANNDRTPKNILLRRDGKLALIDHGNALLYYRSEKAVSGIERLNAVEQDINNMFDWPHKYLGFLQDMKLVEYWIERINQIPDYFIESLVDNISEIENISQEIRDRTKDFLLKRKTYLLDHIKGNKTLFNGLKEG